MAVPALAITVDWDVDGSHADADSDITTDCLSLTYDRSLTSRGTCTVVVNNISKKYNPGNGSGALFGLLKPGRKGWVRATYSAVTYPLFYGTLRRIVLHPETYTAALMFDDITFEWVTREANVALSESRSIKSFRGQLLDDAGVAAGQRSLADGVESNIPPMTGADAEQPLSVLGDLDTATGSISFIRPHVTSGTFYQYVTIDRATIQGKASDETWDAETSAGAVTGMTNYDYTDEDLINSQRVIVAPRVFAPEAFVWETRSVPYSLVAGASRTIYPTFNNPLLNPYVSLSYVGGAPTAVLTPFFNTGKIVVSANASDTTITGVRVAGREALVTETASVLSQNSSSISQVGLRQGSPIQSEWVSNVATADGLADYIVWRFKDLRPHPDITRTNVFPSMLQRELGDVVTFTSNRVNASSMRFIITAIQMDVTEGGHVWECTYTLDNLPAVLDLFTVGGTAGQGVGGTGVLAF